MPVTGIISVAEYILLNRVIHECIANSSLAPLVPTQNDFKEQLMGPLQLTVTWYKIHHAEEQATHWDI